MTKARALPAARPAPWLLMPLLAGAAVLALAGCTRPEPAGLAQARNDVTRARAEADVLRYAQPQLSRAQTALAQSEAAFEDDEPLADVESLAYVASRRAAAAEALGEAGAARAGIERSGEARERALRQTLQEKLADLQAQQTDRGVVVTLANDVLFAVDQATLSPGGTRSLQRVAEALRDTPGATAVIEGHTDSTGSDAYNEALSARRADTVRAELVADGVAPERLVTRAMGEAYPRAPNGTAAGRQQNRRVEIVIQEPAGGGSPAACTETAPPQERGGAVASGSGLSASCAAGRPRPWRSRGHRPSCRRRRRWRRR